MDKAFYMMYKTPQIFPGVWGELRGQEIDDFLNITDFDGLGTDSQYLPQAVLVIMYNCSLLVHVSIPENPGGKEEERKKISVKSRPIVQIQTIWA